MQNIESYGVPRDRKAMVLVLAIAAAIGCQPRAPATAASPVSPVSPEAHFTANSSRQGTRPARIFGGATTYPACFRAAHFTGVAFPGQNDLRVLITDASVAFERHNDKYQDALTLRVQIADSKHALGYDSNIEYRLSPTVDSAGPSLTTWQGRDTIRVLLSWPRGLSPRWLLFSLAYGTISHSSDVSDCRVGIRGDTLRFASGDSA